MLIPIILITLSIGYMLVNSNWSSVPHIADPHSTAIAIKVNGLG